MWNRLLSANGPAAIVIVRVMVGFVFLSEGTQKFLFPDAIGAGRFAKIGLPLPDLLAAFVGSFEIVCGTLVVLGLATRLAVIPTILIMLVALATTKAPILANDGFWKMAHEARTDWSMLLGSVFLLVTGGGRWSMDARFARCRVENVE